MSFKPLLFFTPGWYIHRICDLAKPIVRESMDHVQFDPSAFTVSEAAKKAKASARIQELAQPVQRGS